MAWVWIGDAVARAVHGEQLALHGGAAGVRDVGLLASALARPMNAAAYGKPDAHELAAAYAFGLARNHPFVDGNKRTAFVVGALFLQDNGWWFTGAEADVVTTILALAAGELTEAQLAAWFRANSRPL